MSDTRQNKEEVTMPLMIRAQKPHVITTATWYSLKASYPVHSTLIGVLLFEGKL